MCSTGAADSSLLTLLECSAAARSTLAFGCSRYGEEMIKNVRFAVRTLALGVAVFASCAVRPVYNDQEMRLAESGVESFHAAYNASDAEALYNLFSAETQQVQPRDAAAAVMRQTMAKWGKAKSSTLVFEKVFPGPPIQTRMIYNTEFENGAAQEWFVWTSDGRSALILQYQNFPGYADAKAIKNQ